jgi:hypothetical protein
MSKELLTMRLSSKSRREIARFVWDSLESWKQDIALEQWEYMDLTIACSDAGNVWNYQTGDNSFTGGAYGLPHWAVVSVDSESTQLDLLADIFEQLESLLAA